MFCVEGVYHFSYIAGLEQGDQELREERVLYRVFSFAYFFTEGKKIGAGE